MFDTLPRILLGLLTGFLFGFFLQKGRVSNRRVILGQFLLRDFTVMKIMMTAILVGGIGVYAMLAAGWVQLSIKPAHLATIVLGGLIFGPAMVFLGYCPGTAVAAAGEGKRDAWWGLLGMTLGAAVYSELDASCARLRALADFGPVTLPQITGIPAHVWFAAVLVFAVLFFRWIDSRRAA
ncbi:MAG: YeeE/YedE family protein [Bryobacteraceae bacterium]|nr:YeeE/YedE family protein [Bryobacteraceae bacterium]